jgi:hypothetical protein
VAGNYATTTWDGMGIDANGDEAVEFSGSDWANSILEPLKHTESSAMKNITT